MKSKRKARIMTMQLLYVMEVGGLQQGDALDTVLESLQPAEDQQKYAMKLLDLYQQNHEKILGWIAEYSRDWDPDRLALIDRMVLSLGMTELAFIPDVPPKVALKECVEIARKYSTAESGRFINGILDKFAKNNQILTQ